MLVLPRVIRLTGMVPRSTVTVLVAVMIMTAVPVVIMTMVIVAMVIMTMVIVTVMIVAVVAVIVVTAASLWRLRMRRYRRPRRIGRSREPRLRLDRLVWLTRRVRMTRWVMVDRWVRGWLDRGCRRDREGRLGRIRPGEARLVNYARDGRDIWFAERPALPRILVPAGLTRFRWRSTMPPGTGIDIPRAGIPIARWQPFPELGPRTGTVPVSSLLR